MRNNLKLSVIAFAAVSLLGCASTTEINSLPLTVMTNIEPVDNERAIGYSFTPCKQEICNEAGFDGGGFKYNTVYNPNKTVKNLFAEYIESKYFNLDETSDNKISVELISVEDENDCFNQGTDWFKTPDNISVKYKFKFKLKISYKNNQDELKTFPTVVRKTITSTQKNIAKDINEGVSNAIGLAIIRFDKYLNKNT